MPTSFQVGSSETASVATYETSYGTAWHPIAFRSRRICTYGTQLGFGRYDTKSCRAGRLSY